MFIWQAAARNCFQFERGPVNVNLIRSYKYVESVSQFRSTGESKKRDHREISFDEVVLLCLDWHLRVKRVPLEMPPVHIFRHYWLLTSTQMYLDISQTRFHLWSWSPSADISNLAVNQKQLRLFDLRLLDTYILQVVTYFSLNIILLIRCGYQAGRHLSNSHESGEAGRDNL